jgi:hypothetical protein
MQPFIIFMNLTIIGMICIFLTADIFSREQSAEMSELYNKLFRHVQKLYTHHFS